MSQGGEDVVDWNMPFASYFKRKDVTPPPVEATSSSSPSVKSSPPSTTSQHLEVESSVVKRTQEPCDWDNIEWSRLDKFLQARLVLPEDLQKLQQLDLDGVNDEQLSKAVEMAVQIKVDFDSDFPRRRAVIDKKLNGAFISDRQVWVELVNSADQPDIDERVREALRQDPGATAEAAKRSYIIRRLEDKFVGPGNFAILMQCPAAKLDRAIDRCPGYRIRSWDRKGNGGQKKMKIPSLSAGQLRYLSMKAPRH